MAESIYYADTKAPICPLEIKAAWDTLTPKERRYAHSLARASWLGARITLHQTTPHASDLFDLVRLVFTSGVDVQAGGNLTDEEHTLFKEYCVQVLSNLANYKSFGDSKFIPRIGKDKFAAAIAAVGGRAAELYSGLEDEIFSTTPASSTLLGYEDDGHVTGYYAGVSKEEIKAVQTWLESKGIDALNTRIIKTNGVVELRVSSANEARETVTIPGVGEVAIVHGDFSATLKEVADELERAIPFAANDHQVKMLEAYVRHFRGGDVEDHKESQREWIQDIGPVVESDIGQIETYRDPAGVRAEWEGFVAVVNKEMTKKFERLVQAAPEYIPKLPWGASFEKDKFLKPDFTSLEMLSFATGGVPAGINIPNYDDIRQNFGFKNVSLGNVLNAKAPNEKITFLSEADAALFTQYRGPAFEVQVGIHELLGHGSGKLLQEDKDGSFNFPKDTVNPLTGAPVATWYLPGQTYGSVFKTFSSSYEECRAEAVAMFLSLDRGMLAIFGHDGQEAEDILYVGWLQMCRMGLCALEFWDPQSKKWGQAHMQARHAILRVFVDAGIARIDNDTVVLDRAKLDTQGKKAMSEFLTKLQVYKATADVEAATKLYDQYTSVGDDWARLRQVVMDNRQPRKLLLQANTRLVGDEVELLEYPATLDGFVQSYLDREI